MIHALMPETDTTMVRLASRQLTILLVEDDDDHADLIRRGLEDASRCHVVQHVVDGEAALRYLRRQDEFAAAERPGLVLLDLKIPRLDGHEVLHEIKSDPSLRSIPVVILTTSSAPVDRRRAYENHANSYLVKPDDGFGFEQLGLAIDEYWAGCNQPG